MNTRTTRFGLCIAAGFAFLPFVFGQAQNPDYGNVLPVLIRLSESKQAGAAN